MSKSETILGLDDCVKLAREFADLGEYEKALSKYKIALNMITQRKSEVKDSSLKEKWSQVENIIKDEILLSLKALKIVRTFQNTDETRLNQARQEELKKNPKLKEYLDQQKISQDKTSDTGKGVEEKGNNIKINNKGNEEEKEKDQKNGKSSFYLHYYPKSEGPDGELIEMIEREVIVDSFNIKFEDIVGLEEAKNILKEKVLLPLLMPDFFKGKPFPDKGFLLYGPPLNGKTLLVKALASEGKMKFFNVNPRIINSKWKDKSYKIINIIFEMANFYSPSIIFIDEIDSTVQRRNYYNEDIHRIKAEILLQIDKLNNNLENKDINVNELKKNFVVVIGETNLPWDLDALLRRRLKTKIYIPLPNSDERRKMFHLFLKGVKVQDDFDYNRLVLMTDGFSGGEIAHYCQEAFYFSIRAKILKTGEKINFDEIKKNPSHLMNELNIAVSSRDVEAAIKNICRDPDPSYIKKLEQFDINFPNI